MKELKPTLALVAQKKSEKNNRHWPTFEEMRKSRLRRKMCKERFWDVIGAFTVTDEWQQKSEKTPLIKKSILNSTYYDNEHLHTEEGHEAENGYCMECDLPIGDILE